MPKLTVDGVGTFDVPAGKRLVLALEDEAKIDQLHACGGNARCTTCRVEFVAGEPPQMTAAEKAVLTARGLTGVRRQHPVWAFDVCPLVGSGEVQDLRRRGSHGGIECRRPGHTGLRRPRVDAV